MEIAYNKELLLKYCSEFQINPKVPEYYISKITSEDKDSNLVLPCGSGKTIGLAIALKCCPSLYIVYSASNHERLKDFEYWLTRFELDYKYILNASEVSNIELQYNSCILMTTSMLLQFYNSSILSRVNSRISVDRILILDECPQILNEVIYDAKSLAAFYYMCIGTGNLINQDFEPPIFKINGLVSHEVRSLFARQDIKINFDLAINKDKRSLSRALDIEAKAYFITRILSHMNKDGLSRFCNLPIEDDEIYDYEKLLLIPTEVYSLRFNRSIILDATSDLYPEILPGKVDTLGLDKTYKENIEFVKDLSTNIEILKFRSSRKSIVDNFPELINCLSSTFKENKGLSYVITYNDALFDGEGRDKTANLEIIKQLRLLFDQVDVDQYNNYVLCRYGDFPIRTNENGDFILRENDILISNYNRNRGTNLFKDCQNVYLLGEFRYSTQMINHLLKDTNIEVDSQDLILRLSIGDAVQEISRGVLRMRDHRKEKIFLLGQEDWMQGISKYLGVDIEMYHQSSNNEIESKLFDYISKNSFNQRKANYVMVAETILADSMFSERGKFDFDNEIKVLLSKGFPDKYRRKWHFTKLILEEQFSLSEQEIQEIML